MTEAEQNTQSVYAINFFPKELHCTNPAKEVIPIPRVTGNYVLGDDGSAYVLYSNSLYQIFIALSNGKEISVSSCVAEEILQLNLDVNFNNLSTVLKRVLSDSLIYFILAWPGWENMTEYFKGALTFTDLFDKFTAFLSDNVEYVIRNEKKFRTAGVDAETMTEENSSDTSDVHLEISGPPDALNNVAFFEDANNIVLRQIEVHKILEDLTLKQLLNWPNFSVTICLDNFILTRKNVHEYSRFISLLGKANDGLSESDTVSFAQPTQEDTGHSVYTLNCLTRYIKQFGNVASPMYGLNEEQVSDLTDVMLEFLNDLKEVNVNGGTKMPLATICFNIGKCKYLRSKKILNSRNPRTVNFCEILIPKVEFTLHHFSPLKDDERIFTSYNDTFKTFLQRETLGKSGNCVTYACTFCDYKAADLDGKYQIMSHFETVHKAEESVLCFKCRQEFDLAYLAESRWSHVCKS